MDTSVYHALNNFAYDHRWVGDIAKFFAQDVVFILFGVFALLWLIRLPRSRWLDERGQAAIFAGAFATVIGLLIVQGINQLWDRQRPFVVLHHFHKLIAHPPDASFPSDHVTAASALALTLLLFGRLRLGVAAFIVAVLIGVGRVMVGVHWPTDILGAIGVGLVAAILVTIPRAPLTRLAEWFSALYDRALGGVFAALARLRTPTAR